MALVRVCRTRSKQANLPKQGPRLKSVVVQRKVNTWSGFGETPWQSLVTPLTTAPTIQPKLKIGEPNDKYEREADRVADEVMQMPEPKIQRVCPECEDELQRQPMENKDEEEKTLQTKPIAEEITPLVQRQTEPMEQEKEEETLQPKTPSGQLPTVSSSLQNLRGGGQPLSQSERAFFEPRFGTNFSQVRVHVDTHAASIARAVNSCAFTSGRDIVFDTGQYNPLTTGGRRLLAHELTHVVQQRTSGSALQRAIKFTSPSPIRKNPIERVLSKPTLGFTIPTVNGTVLPNGIQKAGQLIFGALQPKQSTYNKQTKECQFVDFDVEISADVMVITQATNNQWTMNLPGSDINRIAACQSKASVPVTMTGKPNAQNLVNLVDQFEQEHVNDLKGLYTKHLEAHYNFLMSLRKQGDDSTKCQAKLMKALGDKDAKAVDAFLTEWLAAVAKRDAKGGHTLKNTIRYNAGCTYVNIETEKK